MVRKNKSSIDLNAQAQEILRKAEAKGIEHNYMFITTFQRYMEHISHLQELEKEIQASGTLVTKEYVKGRKNVYVNPAIPAYNSTAGAADKTAQLLLRYTSLDEGGGSGDEFDEF